MGKVIVTAAITGGEPVHKGMTPYVPTTVGEVVEEAARCREAGASIVHLHAKEPQTGRPSRDPNPVLRRYVEEIMASTDLICNVTTGGGRRASGEELDAMIEERCGLGRHELPMCTVAMVLGGHARVGMEDNIYLRRGELLKSNAQLVERVATIAEALNLEVATPDEARRILGLR